MASALRTTEQIKSEFAFNFAKNASALGSNYKNYVKKLPMLIKTNGLGASFAFMFSKKYKEEGKYWNQIGSDIYNWLKNQNKFDGNKVKNFEELVAHLNTVNSIEYRMLTAEVLSFLTWLRRFADGLIKGE
ncbi:MAG: type III-B CRISPR module-associated protein Cmr5 [Melioribacteraceae bacterium]|nr:type III-B CRISPR module-associated protein Cmr5 [Melioribacteraceae bacterium]